MGTTSTIDEDKIPSEWASYLQKIQDRSTYEPIPEREILLRSGCSRKMSGAIWMNSNIIER